MLKHVNRMVLFLCLVALVFCGVMNVDAGVSKVACLGGGNTLGTKVVGADRNSYPMYLGYLLGKDYEVRNFGTQKSHDTPNVIDDRVKKFGAEIVVMNFGGDDGGELMGKGDFGNRYFQLIQKYQALAGIKRVLVCLPTRGKRVDAVRRAALKSGAELVDLRSALKGKKRLLADDVYLNNFGAAAVGREVYQKMIRGVDMNFDIFENLRIQKAKLGRFHGYEMKRFKLDGIKCVVVKPRVAVKGKHWIWRARFWGHQPSFDLAMLDRGWHIVYIEVGGLFGNKEAVRRWDLLYQKLTDAGLSDKPVLEGMSRGGLIIYNWAKVNPTRVAGIYGDNPVCDGRSWPGGQGKGKGAKRDWEICLKRFGITQEASKDFKGFPIDGLEGLAKAGVNLFHVVGSADTVVPVSENTDVLKKRYELLGGRMQVIRKAGKNHHPHGLKDVRPLIEFALDCVGERINYCAVAVPSVEYRGGSAGWGGGTWWGQLSRISGLVKKSPHTKIVFLGDSVTQGWTGSKRRLSMINGKRVFDRYFGKYGAIGMGLSGDRTEHLLYRINAGQFDGIKPRVVVLMIGVNNISKGHRGEDIGAGTVAVVKALRRVVPSAKILLLGSFPTGKTRESWRRLQVDQIHAAIKGLNDGKHVFYKDLRDLFLQENGKPNRLMRGDHIHLARGAYEVWAKAIADDVKQMMGD